MTPWRWFAGVVGDHVYDLACDMDSREPALEMAVSVSNPGDHIQVIEARSSEACEHEGSNCVPFLRRRNHETFVIDDDGKPVSQGLT